jgi:hypothetical protein
MKIQSLFLQPNDAKKKQKENTIYTKLMAKRTLQIFRLNEKMLKTDERKKNIIKDKALNKTLETIKENKLKKQ